MSFLIDELDMISRMATALRQLPPGAEHSSGSRKAAYRAHTDATDYEISILDAHALAGYLGWQSVRRELQAERMAAQ